MSRVEIAAKKAAKRVLPPRILAVLHGLRRSWYRVDLGDLRTTAPISNDWGFDRGLPIDRYYIETFLRGHADDIRGNVLEIEEPVYTDMFGSGRVMRSDVLHYCEGNRRANIVADLTRADSIESDSYDCIVFTQTLQFIFDYQAALRNLFRITAPGGIVLATMHGTSRICEEDYAEYWRFTKASAQKLFGDVFGESQVEVENYGNVLSAIGFLHGLAAEELKVSELQHVDPRFEVIIGVRARKPQ